MEQGSRKQKLSPRRILAVCALGWLGLTSACSGWPFDPPPEPTPRPTRTLVPTRTSIPTRTPLPTRTAVPTRTPVPTHTPAATLPPQVVTVIVTATPARRKPASAKAPRATALPAGAPWFFAPHPALPLRNRFRYSIELQAFERGFAVYFKEKDQTWVFASPGAPDVAGAVWHNRSGTLQAGADAFGLGAPRGDVQAWRACAGDIEKDGMVTAYLLLRDKRVLAWTIRAHDYAPQSWTYLQPEQITGCEAGYTDAQGGAGANK